MQLNHLASEVTLSNTGVTTAFKMDANGKAFKMLSDGLYQNKLGSMVREISCNAYDSHIMAGKRDLPIRVHMPDADEPFFSVRDYGIGLDDEGVRDTFTTYFRSTKDSSNDVIGAFGLGSKTPFAYTDAFTIIAIKDGQKRQYSAFIDPTGLPSLTAMSESVIDGVTVDYDVTDEGNGVEIIVPVIKADHFSRFRREVGEQLAFFPVKPTIINAGNDAVVFKDWQSPEHYMSCEGLSVGTAKAEFRGVWVVQGSVGYLMNVDEAYKGLSPESRAFLSIIRESALLFFNIGDIEVTPSRETIQLSAHTLKSINALLTKVRANLGPAVQAQIDSLPDNWTKAVHLNTLESIRELARLTKTGFDAECYNKSGYTYYFDMQKAAGIVNGVTEEDAVKFELGRDKDGNDIAAPDDYISFRQWRCETVRRRQRWEEAGKCDTITPNSNFVLMVRDTNDKPVVRMREFTEKFGHSTKLVTMVNRSGLPVTRDQVDAFIAVIGEGFKNVHYLSDVALPEAQPRGNRPSGYKAPTCYSYDKGDDFSNTKEWVREVCKLSDFADGAYYLTVERNKTDWSRECRILTALFNKGLLDRPIVAIREKDIRRIEDNPKWVLASKMATEVLDRIHANRTMINAHSLKNVRDISFNFVSDAVLTIITEAYQNGDIAECGPIEKMTRLSRTLDALKERAASRGYSDIVATAFEIRPPTTNVEALNKALLRQKLAIEKEFGKSFPLLASIGDYGYGHNHKSASENKAAIVEYVNMKAGA